MKMVEKSKTMRKRFVIRCGQREVIAKCSFAKAMRVAVRIAHLMRKTSTVNTVRRNDK